MKDDEIVLSPDHVCVSSCRRWTWIPFNLCTVAVSLSRYQMVEMLAKLWYDLRYSLSTRVKTHKLLQVCSQVVFALLVPSLL